MQFDAAGTWSPLKPLQLFNVCFFHTWICWRSVFWMLTSQWSQWGSVVAYARPGGTSIELQTALLPWRREAAEVRAARPALGTVLGDGTLPSSVHPPPHPERSSSQRERVWGDEDTRDVMKLSTKKYCVTQPLSLCCSKYSANLLHSSTTG